MRARERRRALAERAELPVIEYRGDDGTHVKTTLLEHHTPPPVWAPWSGDPHFDAWAQTCPLEEWVRYEGPRFSANVWLVSRPPWRPPDAPWIDEFLP